MTSLARLPMALVTVLLSGFLLPGFQAKMLKKIALEEHVAFAASWPLFNHPDPPVEYLQNQHQLLDLEQGRLAERVAAGRSFNVAYQVLSMTGPTQDMRDLATAAANISAWNAALHAQTERFPRQLDFWCVLPMFDPAAALAQLQWCLARGSPGALINGFGTDGPDGAANPNYYNGTQYDGFWRYVEASGALVYLHPCADLRTPLYDDFPELQTSPWGFSVETGQHVLRWILSGFFDKFPNMTIITGHLGEILPFWAWRIDHRLQKQGWLPGAVPAVPENGLHARKHNVTYYLRRNLYITTSGMFDTAAFKHAVEVMGAERVLFSGDTAYETFEEAGAWFQGATAGMPRAVREKIAYGNAAKLLGIKE